MSKHLLTGVAVGALVLGAGLAAPMARADFDGRYDRAGGHDGTAPMDAVQSTRGSPGALKDLLPTLVDRAAIVLILLV